MNKEKLSKEIMKLPKIETNNPIITMNSITIDDIMGVIDRLNKVPDYNDLLKENKQLKKELDCTIGIVEHNRIINEKNKEIHQLKDNWNKLKEIAKSQSGFKKRADLKGGLWFEVDDLLDKMQKLERGDENNEKNDSI